MRVGSCVLEVVTVIALTATACGDPPPDPIQPVDDRGTSRTVQKTIPINIAANMDVLFVIDNSSAMVAFEPKLAADTRSLFAALEPAFGPDLHLAVITTDPADAGRLRRTAAVDGDFISTELQFDGSFSTNVTGALDDAFVALATVGSSGSVSPRALDMAIAALDPNTNPGFLRADAFVLLVFLTAGDDTSASTVESYASAFKLLKADDSKVIVAAAIGPCSANGVSATSAPRLTTLLEQFPNRATLVSICDASLDGLVSLVSGFFAAGTPCLDMRFSASGPECVSWLEHPPTSQQRLIEPCPETSVPCWFVNVDPAMCPGDGNSVFRLDPPGWRSNTGTVLNIECVVTP